MKLLLLIIMLFFCINSYAAETVAELKAGIDNNHDNIAACTLKSNDFVFLCLLNKQNHNSCKFMLGTQFTLPKCDPTPSECESKSVVVKPKDPVKPTGNPLLDLLMNRNK